MCGRAARLARIAGHRFTSSVAAQSSSVASWNDRPPVEPPTLFTSTSSRPNAAAVCSTACADADASAHVQLEPGRLHARRLDLANRLCQAFLAPAP